MKHIATNSIFLMAFFSIFIACSDTSKNINVVEKELISDWTFKEIGQNEQMPATVPGSIVMDLLANRKISDPFFGTNNESIHWIEKRDWEYQTIFSLDDEIFTKKHIELVFRGLDSCSKVILNDSVILLGGNRFFENLIDCKPILKRNHNKLVVKFYSTHQYCYHIDSMFFGCGILRPIQIKAWNTAKIVDYQLFQESLNRDKGILKVKIDLQSDIKQVSHLKFLGLEKSRIDTSITLTEGLNHFEFTVEIDKPKLWWTNGLGSPNLYDFKIVLDQNNKIIDEETLRFGFRKLELVKNSLGLYFKLNDIPIFIKGADYLPQDIHQARVKSERYKHLIQSAKMVNMNMLHVVRGGIYENDEFYDLCDENGILVWQDFMDNGKNDTSELIHVTKLKNQYVQNIKHLRNHPCLAVWCEEEQENDFDKRNDKLQKQNKSMKKINILKDTSKSDFLEQIVQNQDSGRAYLKLRTNAFIDENKVQNNFNYNLPGYLSYPLLSTLNQVIDNNELYRYSSQLKAHQKYPNGFELIQENILSSYKIPGHIIPYVYVSQLLQAENLTKSIKEYRREKGKYMGAIFHQYNDYWPGITYSGIDYYGRWKALHYYLRNAYAPILISAVMDNNTLKVYAISDEIRARKMNLSIYLIDFYGSELWVDDKGLNVKALSSEIVYTQDLSDFLADSIKNKVMIHIKLLSGKTELARENLYFKEVKDLDLPDPDVVFNITKKKGKFIIQMMTDYLAKNIFLDFPEDNGNFSDNYFDLLPGEQKTIEFTPEYPGQKLEGVMGVRSLYDVY